MRTRRGFALIAALWFVVLLSGLALEFSLAGRNVRSATLNANDGLIARASASAGMEHAIATLHSALKDSARLATAAYFSGRGDPWQTLSRVSPDSVKLEGLNYSVQLRDAGSVLNVNLATEDELRRLFVALRIDAGMADRLAQTLADWRDADDLHRARGAEVEQYLKSGARVLPLNRKLQSVSEARWINGMTSELFDRIAPMLTTEGSGRINLRTASRPVLLALPGMSEEAVGLIARVRRDASRPLDPNAIHGMLSSGARAIMFPHLAELVGRTVSATSEVEVISTGWVQHSNVRATTTVLVVRAGDEIITSSRRWR